MLLLPALCTAIQFSGKTYNCSEGFGTDVLSYLPAFLPNTTAVANGLVSVSDTDHNDNVWVQLMRKTGSSDPFITSLFKYVTPAVWVALTVKFINHLRTGVLLSTPSGSLPIRVKEITQVSESKCFLLQDFGSDCNVL